MEGEESEICLDNNNTVLGEYRDIICFIADILIGPLLPQNHMG